VDGRAEVAPPLEQVRPAGTHSLWDFATAALGALCGGLTSPSPLARQGKLGHLLLLRHPGLAQPGEISGFEQSADLRHAPIIARSGESGGLDVGQAGISIVVA
jgi:hypothetical protein